MCKIPQVLDFADKFVDALMSQLADDQEQHGDSWLEQDGVTLVDHALTRIEAYITEYERHGTPIPWLKVAGYALIGWIQAKHPGLFLD